MVNEKRPSIYQDRGTIGSAKELDEYGVWVKSEPQDLAGGGKDAGEEDFSLNDLDDLPDFPMDSDSSSGEDSGAADMDFSLPEDDFSIDGGEDAAFSFDAEDQPAGEFADFSLEGDDSVPGFSLNEEDLSLPEEIPAVEAAAPEDDAPENPVPDEDAEGFDEISLDDLLGDVADEVPGLDAPEEGAAEEHTPDSLDKSTQLLMKIAEELSSIRAELSALKQEFSSIRTAEGEQGESRGFFSGAGGDDKIALTGDELDNILNTAEFTEEAGINAVEEDQFPGFSEGDAPEAPAGVSPETDSSIIEAEPAGGAEEPIDVGNLPEMDELDEFGAEVLDDSELSLVDLSDGGITEDFSIEESPGGGIEDLPAADLEFVIEENPAGGGPDAEDAADSEEPDVSLDVSFSEEDSIALENFDEDALDLTGAVIEEPDLGGAIEENPILEPAPDEFVLLEEGLEESDETPIPELEILSESFEEPAVEILEDADLPPIEEIEDEEEISRTEESAAEIPAAGEDGSRGEELDQIIPEGFVVEELDDEGETDFGGAGFDTLEEGISLDEIPEDVLPEEEGAGETAEAAGPDEPEVSALPGNFKTELKQVLSYMDQLLESLPEEKIEEFAKSEYFDTYKKLFKELGLA
jgi:hypothetical protein